MTAPLRQPVDAFTGTIAPCVATAATMTSPVFASLPLGLSSGWYVPAEIVDETTGAHESIRIIGADGSTTAAVVRGVEGTSPRTWDQPTTIRCGPAVYDLLQVVNRVVDIPPDLHVGARVLAAEESLVREQTQRQGPIPAVRGGAGDAPRTLAGLFAHYPDEALRIKALQFGPLTTNISGEVRVRWDAGALQTYEQGGATDGASLRWVAFVMAQGYLPTSDYSWDGRLAVNYMMGPPWWVQLLAFNRGTRDPFAYRQVSGSVLVVGA